MASSRPSLDGLKPTGPGKKRRSRRSCTHGHPRLPRRRAPRRRPQHRGSAAHGPLRRRDLADVRARSLKSGSLNHLRLSVRDVAASAAFYDPLLTALGWSQIPRDDGGRAWERRDPIAGLQWLILTPVAPQHRDAPPHDLTAPGFHHLALNADDRDQVDRLHRLLLDRGADILDPPAEYDYDPGYYALFVRDPDGFKIEVVHIP